MPLATWLQDGVVRAGAFGIGRMSPAFRERVAQQLARQWLGADARFSSLVLGNLRRALPALPAGEIEQLALANAQRTARAQLDHFWSWHARRELLLEAVQFDGLAQLDGAAPTVIAGSHRLGFEVALMRLSIDVSGALIVDPGATPLPRAARRAWSRFRPQRVIEARGAARPALAAVREGRPLLVLVEEPSSAAAAGVDESPHAPVLALQMRFTPLVALLVRLAHARVLWLDVRTLGGGRYAAALSEPLPAGAMADAWQSAQALAARLDRSLRADPAGYWWARCAFAAAAPRPPSAAQEQIGAKVQSSAERHAWRAG